MDPVALERAWDSYAESVRESRPRIYSTLTSNRPVVGKDGRVRVTLNSEAQRENFIRQIKTALIRHILGETGWPNLEIETEVAEGEFNGNRIYTDQDKLDFLIRKNPDLGWLKTRFNLDFDE